MSDSPEPAVTMESARGISREAGPFFSVGDRIAFAAASIVAFAGYWYTLAPSVTLEDSGGFLTAAHNLGVPHPPGYPVWTILAWIWQWIIPFGSIAWRVNLMSAFFGALAVGLAALLISKSGQVMASRCGFLQVLADEPALRRIILASSVSASLILAFSPVMWSQAVITEVYTLSAFLLMVTLALLYRWSFETERHGWLYLAAFVWGVSLTNHQTLVLLTVAFPTFVWLADRKLGRDLLAPILWVIVLGVFKMVVTPGQLVPPGKFLRSLDSGTRDRRGRVVASAVEGKLRVAGAMAAGARDVCRGNSRAGVVRLSTIVVRDESANELGLHPDGHRLPAPLHARAA